MRIKNKRAVSRTLLSALVGLLIIGLGLGLGSYYSINGFFVKPHSHHPSTSFPPITSLNESVSVSCNPATVEVSSKTSCTATLTNYSKTPRGTILWKTNQTGTFSSDTCTLSSGSCTVSYRPSSAGEATIKGTYSETNNLPISGTYLLSVARKTSQVSLSCSAVITVGQPSTCTAKVSGYGTPSGNASFSVSGAGTFNPVVCTLIGGSCSVQYTPLSVSSESIIASYTGDSNNNASSSLPYVFTVGAGPSSVTITCSPSTVPVDSPTSCKTTVSGYYPGGLVSWTANTTGTFSSPMCTLISSSCQVTYTPSSSGTTSLTASYSGDANNLGSSGTFDLSVGSVSTTVVVYCSPNAVPIGSQTSCTATVTGYNPSGFVSWSSTSSGIFSQSSCTLSSGSCSVTYTVESNASPITITASYSGDTNNAPNSGTFVLTVGQISVSCSPNPISVGSLSTCTVTVIGNSPTGRVTFSSNDTGAAFSPPNAMCRLSPSGSCQVGYTPSVSGTANITAVYPGDYNNAPSSASFLLTVGQVVPTVTVSCAPNPVASGANTTCTVSVTGYGIPSGLVTWQTSGVGSFSSNTCDLSSGQCSVTYTASDSPGSVIITAAYSGDKNNSGNQGSTQLNVI